MAIPAINVLGNPNVTEGNFQIAIEDLRKSVIGSGKAYDSANTYSQYDTCVYSGVVYYSKINSNTGNTPAVGTNWGLIGDLITGVIHNIGNESIDGVKTFTSSPIVPTPITTGNIITMGNILEKTVSKIGYDAGAGGQVIQLTSKSTSVTLNKPCGTIVTSSSSLAAGATVGFYMYNNLAEFSTICVIETNSGNYNVSSITESGDVYIRLTNVTGASLSETIAIRFVLIKGVNV